MRSSDLPETTRAIISLAVYSSGTDIGRRALELFVTDEQVAKSRELLNCAMNGDLRFTILSKGIVGMVVDLDVGAVDRQEAFMEAVGLPVLNKVGFG